MLKTADAYDSSRGLPVSSASGAGTSSHRLVSLDAYRGFIMLTLLSAGIFAPLKYFPDLHWLAIQTEHTDWQGCTFWDLIQPSFMFMVGVAMPFACARRKEMGHSWLLQCGHMFVRAINLILVGIFLDHIWASKIEIGFMRVLQQIALGYIVCFFLLGRPLLVQGIVAAVILIGYNLLWTFNHWNVPGKVWDSTGHNIGVVFDMWMIGRNYKGFYVGMNAIPSTATILFGVMAGELLRLRLPHGKTMLILLIAGVGGVIIGLSVSPWLPLIKRIWTPSFAVFAGGCTTLMLLFFYAVIEVLRWRRWAFPLIVVGMNSIAAYVIGNGFKPWFRDASRAWIDWLWKWLWSTTKERGWMNATWASGFRQPLEEHGHAMLSGLLFAGFAWVVLFWCYRRKVFFKL